MVIIWTTTVSLFSDVFVKKEGENVINYYSTAYMCCCICVKVRCLGHVAHVIQS
jgi:hypothetical protein